MIDHGVGAPDDRVLLVAPTRKDAETALRLLRTAGIAAAVHPTLDAALRDLGAGAAALMFPEEAITSSVDVLLSEVLNSQPPWSDLPLLVLARAGADSAASRRAVETLGNVTLLERPLRASTLVSAVRTAVRARQRQYQIRGHLAERARAEAALRAADQRKDEFLATLGHELRNPLAPLLTGLRLLRSSGTLNPAMLRTLTIMDRQVAHLTRLVADLLEVSRITRGLVDVRHDVVDLVTVVRESVETVQPLFDAASHSVAVDLPATPLLVAGDAVRLGQVFGNLLMNAAKYTMQGGRIRVAARAVDGTARVSVLDNGVGIPPSHLAAIFDMFMQVDRSQRHAQGGLGIGLTLVRTLVELHHGRVEAHSAGPNQGSEFVVTLPLAAAAASHPAAVPAAPIAFPGRRILIVDDNRDAGEMLGALLETLGATVMVVHSGVTALDCLDRFRPDTLLLDIGMPEMNGYELARRIRRLPGYDRALLIALTGWGQDDDQRQSRAAGFDHHLVKPPDLDVLRTLLARHEQRLTGPFDSPDLDRSESRADTR